MATDPVARLLEAVDHPIAPRAAFAEALLDRLLAELEGGPGPARRPQEAPMTDATSVRFPSSVPLRSAPEANRAAIAGRPRRAMAHLAFAALLLLTLGSAFIAFGGRQWGATPAPAPGGVDQLLVRASSSTPPTSTGRWTGIERLTIAPGTTLAVGPGAEYVEGIFLFVVESGAVEFEAEGDAGYVRAKDPADRIAPIAPGETAALTVGDRGFVPSRVFAQWRNVGTEPAVLLDGSLAATDTGSAEGQRSLVATYGLAWPEPAVGLELHRVSLEPGAELPSGALPGLALLYVDAGEIEVSLGTAAAPRTRAFAEGEGMVAAQWDLRADGVLRNSADQPTVLFVLTMIPAAPPATPAS